MYPTTFKLAKLLFWLPLFTTFSVYTFVVSPSGAVTVIVTVLIPDLNDVFPSIIYVASFYVVFIVVNVRYSLLVFTV